MRRLYPFHVLTAGIFSLLVLLAGGAISAMAYVQQRDMLLAAVAATMESAARPVQPAAAADVRALAQSRLADILSRFWWQTDSRTTQAALLDASGHVLAASHGIAARNTVATLDSIDLPVLAAVAIQPVRGKAFTQEIGGQPWLVLAHAAEATPRGPMLTVIAAPLDEILAGMHRPIVWTLLLAIGCATLAIWLIARRTTHSLRHLASAAASVNAFRFSGAAIPGSLISEVDTLARTIAQLRVTLRRFLDISTKLSAERRYDRLLDEIVEEAILAAHAGAGIVFIHETSGNLRPMAWKHLDGEAHPVPETITPSGVTIFSATLERKEPQQLAVASIHLPPGLEWLGGWFPGHAMQILLVPLGDRSGKPLGLLLLARGFEKGPYDPELLAFIDALSGTMAITIEKQKLLDGRTALLDGVVRMIAGAIDARSPYTGAHCQRVPELAAMLADAAARHPDSPYRDMHNDDSARESLHLAAWLHDCGKLFVPDYIADKATKLDAVYNRIHEIRTRFEVLKRDAEIDYWRKLTAGGNPEELRQHLDDELHQLDADFAFIAECNRGTRTLSDADIAHIVRIGSRTWLRTIDDRLGISEEERLRKDGVPPRPLPTPEHLLADRLEHLLDIPMPHGKTAPHRNRAHREHMPPPRHRLNLGELYALGVRHGTLTPEERYLINAHILGTIGMLSTLPFPEELAAVPEIAGSHHEHLDGSGYPAGKRANELSLAARILAIADIYEALTAADRPYKPGKSADEALTIMRHMAHSGHIDGKLLDLFERAGIPARYAARGADASPAKADAA